MKTLPQLQAEQKAAGLTARHPDDESAVGPIVARPATVPACPTEPERLVPKVRQLYTRAMGQGFTRLLPPTAATLAGLDAAWIAENWQQPSPWCQVEGLPDHPEFQNNLLAFKNAL